MNRCGRRWIAVTVIALLAGCGKGAAPGVASSSSAAGDAPSKILNLYIWSDYLPPNALSDFERDTGIKVNVSYFDTNETLETRLLAGHTGAHAAGLGRSVPVSLTRWRS